MALRISPAEKPFSGKTKMIGCRAAGELPSSQILGAISE